VPGSQIPSPKLSLGQDPFVLWQKALARSFDYLSLSKLPSPEQASRHQMVGMEAEVDGRLFPNQNDIPDTVNTMAYMMQLFTIRDIPDVNPG